MKLNYFSLNTTLLGLSRLNNNVVKRRNTTVIPPSPSRPEGLIGQYKPYLNSNDSPTRDILKDYSGQGHDIQLYNFAFAESSGYGSWAYNMNKVSPMNSLIITKNYKKFRIETKANAINSNLCQIGYSYYNFNVSYKLKCTSNVEGIKLSFFKSGDTSINIPLNNNGITDIQAHPELSDRLVIFSYGNNLKDGYVEIELIPDYPGALVSDGVDDYGICENFPILTKEKGYTVFALRKILGSIDTITAKSCLVSNYLSTQEGAFYVEYFYDDKSWRYLSWGIGGKYDINLDTSLIVQTTNKYNNESINSGSALVGTNKLQIFKLTNWNGYLPCALYALEIYNHDLTDEEIQNVKEAMYNEYLTATNALQNHIIADYECYDKTNEDEDRDILKDLSGNGHDIQLLNFGFAEGSGYGKYAVDWLSSLYLSIPSRGTATVNHDKITITSSSVGFSSPIIQSQQVVNIPSFKVKVTGIKSELLSYRYTSERGKVDYFKITKDGIYDIPASYQIEDQRWSGWGLDIVESCNITIEQIPEYQGALVSDGVDDYGLCENLPILNKEDGFTILAIRKYITSKAGGLFAITDKTSQGYINKNLISFESNAGNGVIYFSVFGGSNIITKYLSDNPYTFATSKTYNGLLDLTKGDIVDGTNLYLFDKSELTDQLSNTALYALTILNKDCTTEEIKFLAKQMVARHKEKTGETITLNI